MNNLSEGILCSTAMYSQNRAFCDIITMQTNVLHGCVKKATFIKGLYNIAGT